MANATKICCLVILLAGAPLFAGESDVEVTAQLKAAATLRGEKRENAIKQIAAMNPPPIAALIKILDDSNSGVDEICVVRALAKIGKPAVQPLLDFIAKKPSPVHALEALRDMGPPAGEALPVLLRLCSESKDEQTRCSAADALGEIATSQNDAFEQLAKTVANDSSDDVKAAAESAVIKLKMRKLPSQKQDSPEALKECFARAAEAKDELALLSLHHPYCINYSSARDLKATLLPELANWSAQAKAFKIRDFKKPEGAFFPAEPSKEFYIEGNASIAIPIGSLDGKWYVIRAKRE